MPAATRPRLLRRVEQELARELGAFGVVGAVCFVLDLALFQLLYAHAGTGAVTAKVVSTVVSMTVAFVGHRYWAFARRARTRLRREYLLFVAVNLATLLVSVGLVALVRYPLGQTGVLILQLTNVVSIAVGSAIRFLAYRRWVFPAVDERPPAGAPSPLPAPH